MNEMSLVVGALAAALLIVVLYMAVRDKQTTRKLAMLERSIDTLNQELFTLDKNLKESRRQLLEELMKFELQERQQGVESAEVTLRKELRPFTVQLQELQEQVDAIRKELGERVEKLDGKVRQVAFVSEHTAIDEQKILQLHAQGMDAERIAKQLRLGKGEVELVLKFSKIHA